MFSLKPGEIRAWLVLVAWLMIYVSSSHGLYEDQVGRFDWRHQFVGRASHIHRSSSLWQYNPTLILSTHSNVVASLNLKNGSLSWRHILESPYDASTPAHYSPINHFGSAFDSSLSKSTNSFECPVISVNGYGRWVRCWSIGGVLLGDYSLPSELVQDVEQDPDDYSLLFETYHSPQTLEPFLLIAKFCYSKSNLMLYTYSLTNRKLVKLAQVVTENWLKKSSSCSLITHQNLVCANEDGVELQVLTFDPTNIVASTDARFKRISLVSFGLKSDSLPKYLAVVKLPYQSESASTLSTKNQGKLFAIDLGGDGHLVLKLNSQQVTQSSPANQVQLVKILPRAIKLTLIPLVPTKSQEIESTESVSDEVALAVLFAKEDAVKFDGEVSSESDQKGETFAFKLSIFNLATWAEVSSLTSPSILFEFNSKRSVSPVNSKGALVKTLTTKLRVDQFEILPIFSPNGRYSYKLVLGTVDGTLIVSNLHGKVTWSREEALAEIVNTVMLDFPLSETEATLEQEYGFDEGGSNLVSLFVNRIKSQLIQLSTAARHAQQWVKHHWTGNVGASLRKLRRRQQGNDEFDAVSTLESVEQEAEFEDDEEEEEFVRDYFGLHKVVIIRTKIGKIFAMHSLSGKLIWTKYEPTLLLADVNSPYPTWIQRTSAYYPHSAICTFLSKHPDSKNSIIYSFDPFNGRTLDYKQLPYQVIQAMQVNTVYDHEYRRPLLLLDSQLKAHLYPETVLDQFVKVAPSYYIMLTNQSSGHLTGYSFAKSNSHDGIVVSPVWNLDLPVEQEESTTQDKFINLKVVFKRSTEHVHSQGRVLGDRNVLYKYLNPNLVAVLWQSQDGQDKPMIVLYLIDSITGSVVYSTVHKRARGPVQIVHSENWIIYSYFNENKRRNEISSIELYEGLSQVNSTAFSSFGRDLAWLPIVEQASFIFPTGIGIMTDTETQKGITNKNILISLPTGGLLELPRAFLDPRRPIKPTQEHAEEGLIPYMPELPVPSEKLINYNQSIHQVRGIQTAPTSLESTSLVFTYGLDIFFTRVTPSKTFDVLKDDFDFLLIVAVLVGLIVASYIGKLLAARKQLNAVWK